MLTRKNSIAILGCCPLLLTIYEAITWRSAKLFVLIAGTASLAVMLAWAFRGGQQLTAAVKGFLSCSGMFCVVVLGCLLLLLLVCSLAGYLPYSDRPGPGWGTPNVPSWEEIRFYAGWELMNVPAFFFWGTILFAFAAFLGWLRTPLWLVRLIAGLLCGLSSLLLTAAAGWYIALGVFVTNAGGIFGLLFGVFVLPKFATESGIQLPLWLRCVAISVASLAMATAILYPLFR